MILLKRVASENWAIKIADENKNHFYMQMLLHESLLHGKMRAWKQAVWSNNFLNRRQLKKKLTRKKQLVTVFSDFTFCQRSQPDFWEFDLQSFGGKTSHHMPRYGAILESQKRHTMNVHGQDNWVKKQKYEPH